MAGTKKTVVRRGQTILFGSLVIAIAVATWRFREPMVAWLEARNRRQAESERAYFERVGQACLANEASAAFNAIMAWIDRTSPSDQANTLESFSRQVHDAELKHQLDQLQRAVIGRDKNWNGLPLWSALSRVRQRGQINQRSLARRKTVLPDLNPADSG